MKKIITWLSLLTIVLGVFIPSVSAADTSSDTQSIINSNELKVDVTHKLTDKGISWTIDYSKEAKEKQRLKFRLTSSEQEVVFPKKKNWQQVEEWFTEVDANKSSNGTISLVTEEDLSELFLEVQIDTEETDNILSKELQGPHLLDFPKTESTSESSNEMENNLDVSESLLNEERVDSINQPNALRSLAAPSLRAAIPYQDPFTYSSTNEGVFPESWTNQFLNGSTINTNQEDTTRNFDYGKTYNGPPANKNIIGGTNSFLNGYHKHPNPDKTDDRSSVLTKKIVKPTTNPNQFEISVDVISGASEVAKPVDVVFVIDKSGSMQKNISGTDVGFDNYNSRWQMTKRSLDKLSKSLLAQGNDVRLSAVSFGSDWSSSSGNTAVWAENSNFNGSPFTNNATAFMNNTIITTNPTTSGTPTYMGVELGTKILQENARSEAKKFLIVLTDGMATFYPSTTNPQGISSAIVTNPAGKRVFKLAAGKFLGDGSESGNNPRDAYNGTISYLNTRIYNSAYYDKVNEFSKYSIGLGATGTYIPGTLAAIGKDGQFDAQSESDLNKAIESISRVIRGYEDVFTLGTATDPMSQYVDLVGGKVSNIRFDALTLKDGTPNVLQVIGENESNFPVYAQTVKTNAKFEDNTIKLSEINLSGSESERTGIRFTYTVELKEEYRDGKFYPANGPTSAKAFNYDESVSFAVPSVRADVFDLPIIKDWQDDENHWNKRQDITIQLESKVGSGNWTKVTGKTVTIPKNATGKDLEHVFSNLAKKDASGQIINYRVVETSAGSKRVLGYRDPSYDKEQVNANTENKLITIRNKLMSTPIEFVKVNGGREKLEGVVFTLSAEGKTEIIQEVTSDKDGKVMFDAVPIGKYVLTEKTSLEGYEPIKPIQIEVKQNETTGNLEIIGLPENKEVINKLKDFELKVAKVDQDNQPVLGVEFELTNLADGAKVKLQADDVNGNLFTFSSLKPGNYELKETVTPNNYVGLEQPIKISIGESGKVTIDGKDDVATVTLGEKNTIEIQVANTLKGLLPSTGGSGTKAYLIGTLVISSLIACLGMYYFYRNHRGGRVK